MTSTSQAAGGDALGWMPLRLVALAPLAGHNTEFPPGLIRVVKGDISPVMARVAPRVNLKVPGPGTDKVSEISLSFDSLDDFRPESIVARVPAAAELLAGGDQAAVSKWLDAVLHQPAFLELEGAWRGLDFLAGRGGAGEGSMTPLILEALAFRAGEDYTARFRSEVFDPDYEDRADVPLAAVIADQAFDHQPASLARLTALAGLAAALQSPFIASVGPSIFGLKNLAHLPSLPDLVTRATGGPYASWNAFQRDNTARWVSLTVNRFLLRSPYTAGNGPAGGLQYAETVDPAHPEWLCWGGAVWAVGVSMARSFSEHGHCAASDGLSGTGGHHGLPTRELQVSLTKKVQMTTEVQLADEKAWELCRAGFTPLVGIADGDIAYFPFLGNAHRVRTGSITMDQALTYQLYAGQMSHVLLKLSSRLPAGDPAGACAWLERQIFNYLSPWVGEQPGQNVRVTPAAQPDGSAVASIHVTPTFKIQDKAIDLELGLPLR